MYDFEPKKEIKPRDNDYIVGPCSERNANTCVSTVTGAFVGEFGNNALAQIAIRMDMDTKRMCSNVWYKDLDGKMRILSVHGL